ncbi:MAG TPA: mechanosensitive ion channel domain-containing protein [Thermoanaerobaculia bacterium]|nr:mechanosensitive ion channel domain-containing protein [Thermoanaerobaculia bacterium]
MHMTLALLASVGAFAALVALVAWLQRKLFFVRQLTFPLWIGAAAAALEVFLLLEPNYRTLELHQALGWLLLFCGLTLLLRLLALYLFEIHLVAQRGIRLPPLLSAVTMAVVYLATALITLRLSFPNVDISALVATSAVTSLVLGLALQPILSNFFAGLVVSLERPFRINDWIRVGEHEGRVVAITWRTTHLRTRENDNLVIPNGKLADERVLNFYYPHPMHMERVKVGADYNVPPYRVRRALLEAVTGVVGTLDKPSPDVYVLSFDADAILYELRVWIEDMAQSTRIASDLRARVWEEFKKAGIKIPHPIRTLELSPRPKRTEARIAEGPRPARLYVAEGPERGRTLGLDGSPVIVGRSRGCSLALTEPNASKEHLRIAWEGDAWVLTDLESSFGTRVNNQPTQRKELAALDRIMIGDTVIIFESFESDAH